MDSQRHVTRPNLSSQSGETPTVLSLILRSIISQPRHASETLAGHTRWRNQERRNRATLCSSSRRPSPYRENSQFKPGIQTPEHEQDCRHGVLDFIRLDSNCFGQTGPLHRQLEHGCHKQARKRQHGGGDSEIGRESWSSRLLLLTRPALGPGLSFPFHVAQGIHEQKPGKRVEELSSLDSEGQSNGGFLWQQQRQMF
jgi:hypothetical protein